MRAVPRAGTPKDVAYRARALRARACEIAKYALNINAIVVVKTTKRLLKVALCALIALKQIARLLVVFCTLMHAISPLMLR